MVNRIQNVRVHTTVEGKNICGVCDKHMPFHTFVVLCIKQY